MCACAFGGVGGWNAWGNRGCRGWGGTVGRHGRVSSMFGTGARHATRRDVVTEVVTQAVSPAEAGKEGGDGGGRCIDFLFFLCAENSVSATSRNIGNRKRLLSKGRRSPRRCADTVWCGPGAPPGLPDDFADIDGSFLLGNRSRKAGPLNLMGFKSGGAGCGGVYPATQHCHERGASMSGGCEGAR